jgi:hypothetical protein
LAVVAPSEPVSVAFTIVAPYPAASAVVT